MDRRTFVTLVAGTCLLKPLAFHLPAISAAARGRGDSVVPSDGLFVPPIRR